MKIILYSNVVHKVSGVQTWELNFCKQFHKEHEITYIYTNGNSSKISEFKKYVKTSELHPALLGAQSKIHFADLCIFSSIQHGEAYHTLIANKYIQIVHCDLAKWHVDYKPAHYIDEHIAVGEGVAESLKTNFNIESTVIPNIMPKPQLQNVLRLVTASRIREGKGFDKVVEFAKALKNAGKPFIWEIYGEGPQTMIEDLKYQLTGIPEVLFMGARTDVQSYMVGADYLVQFSLNEGFCYSAHEALQIGIPCIVNTFNEEKLIKNGENGYVVDNITPESIELICNKIPRNFKYKENQTSQKWKELFDKIGNENN